MKEPTSLLNTLGSATAVSMRMGSKAGFKWALEFMTVKSQSQIKSEILTIYGTYILVV